MLVAAPGEIFVDVAHELRLRRAEHDLQVRRLEADVLVAVDDVRRAGDAVPRAEHGLHALARAVLEEDLHLALQDEEDFLDLVRVRGVALARRNEHDAQREVLGRDEIRAAVLSGAAGADEPVLRAAVAVDARVGERVPVGRALDEARDLPGEELVEAHFDSPAPGGSTRTASPVLTVPGTSTRA